ncbi:MAG TPA: DUF1003 domain-containing protein [Pirellulales bacterium]|nr:DUF1003 domain-containing protein [Pirellulales bacterium]
MRKGAEPPGSIPSAARRNIQSVTQIEHDFVRHRSRLDRLGEAITRYAGSMGFLVAHVCGFAAWMIVNEETSPGAAPFDPYPYSFLGLLVSFEAVFLSTFVLMTQKRQTREQDHWAHLNLQIGLLTEQENTKVLQMLASICDQLGLKTKHDDELREMSETTGVAELAEELAHNLEKTRDAAESRPEGESSC